MKRQWTRSEAFAIVDALGNQAAEQRVVYADLLLATKDLEGMFRSYYDIVLDLYRKEGQVPPTLVCLTGTGVPAHKWDDFYSYYFGHVRDLVVRAKHPFAIRQWINCYVDLLFALKRPPSIREDIRRMLWKLFDTDAAKAQRIISFILTHEDLPLYERPPEYVGGLHRARKGRRQSRRSRSGSRAKKTRKRV